MGGGVTGREAGFSLIELVVVVAVLSVVAVGAGLAVGRGSDGATADAQRFARLVEVARASAVIGRQPEGLFVTATELRRAAWVDGAWQPSERGLRWRDDVLLRLETPRPGPAVPHLVFLPDGSGTAFEIAFAPQPTGRRARCRGDGAGPMRCDAG
ncbi:GspH/FimT family protein [Jannaschia seohaensis]|uniref:Type II secretion system protein H n=1 Tax=Jannaschia seohaensis TaxID=475081 RepID=A0A2Y9AZA1_9RHOB|nr:GspH/FimT family protein [Jannaschia seohaensis]PWJ15792.1 type II secretion system protein H [Jannaschia seohaensis]SSA49476.1 type II secretion system protein H [Jannaschia seohaensis]